MKKGLTVRNYSGMLNRLIPLGIRKNYWPRVSVIGSLQNEDSCKIKVDLHHFEGDFVQC